MSGSAGLTNAYTSVLSATGSLGISGASRCEDISLASRRVQDPGHQVAVVDHDLAFSDEQPHLGPSVVVDHGQHRLRRPPRTGPGDGQRPPLTMPTVPAAVPIPAAARNFRLLVSLMSALPT